MLTASCAGGGLSHITRDPATQKLTLAFDSLSLQPLIRSGRNATKHGPAAAAEDAEALRDATGRTEEDADADNVLEVS